MPLLFDIPAIIIVVDRFVILVVDRERKKNSYSINQLRKSVSSILIQVIINRECHQQQIIEKLIAME
jgi:hypothetical protein